MEVASLSLVWFLLRAFRLTASVVAVAIGLGNVALPAALWTKIRTNPLEKSEDNEACAHGRREEPNVISETSRRLDIVITEGHYRTDPNLHWLGATPDGEILDDTFDYMRRSELPPRKALLECKAPFYCPYGHAPIYYVIQTYVQMKVEGLQVNYLSSYWDSGRCMRIWRVRWSDEVWHWIMVRLVIFVNCLYNDVPPSPTLLPHVYEPCQELLDTGFAHGARERIATKHSLHPNMLIPDIPIEMICFDEDPFRYVDGKKIRKNIPTT